MEFWDSLRFSFWLGSSQVISLRGNVSANLTCLVEDEPRQTFVGHANADTPETLVTWDKPFSQFLNCLYGQDACRVLIYRGVTLIEHLVL